MKKKKRSRLTISVPDDVREFLEQVRDSSGIRPGAFLVILIRGLPEYRDALGERAVVPILTTETVAKMLVPTDRLDRLDDAGDVVGGECGVLSGSEPNESVDESVDEDSKQAPIGAGGEPDGKVFPADASLDELYPE